MAKPDQPTDRERNRLSARAARYAQVGANVGGVAARYAGRRLLGGEPDRAGEASALSSALGRLKGPLMKVAQLMATIPDLLPAEYTAEDDKHAFSVSSGKGSFVAAKAAPPISLCSRQT